MNVSKISNAIFDIPKALPKIAQEVTSSIPDSSDTKKLTSALDCLAANAVPSINKSTKKPDIPEFIYHITSKENYEKILKDGKMKISDFEGASQNGCKGIYFVDKENFLTKWVGRTEPELFGEGVDIGDTLMLWTCKSDKGTVAIRIPTSSLDQSQLRFRPYIKASKEAFDTFDPDTMIVGSKMVKEGLPIEDLVKYTNTDEPIEYVYFGEITPKMFSGYSETSFSENMREMINNLFG